MATISENLATAKANLAANLASITANPKPSYSVDGKSYSWTEYMTALLAAIKGIDDQLAADAGPSEVVICGDT
jgi:hypothetical protein